MRGTEIIASMVDKVYVTALTSQKSGGPASKHHAPKSAQVQSHPCFVLQLTCPPDSYDVLCEPDKTMAVFSNPHLVKLCVKKLLLLMFGEYRPDLEAAVECLCGGDVSEQTEVRSRVRDMNDGSDAENTIPEVNNLYAVQAKGRAHAISSSNQSKDTTQRFDRTVMSESPDFKSVFLSKTPPETLINGKADPLSASQPISLFAEFEFSTTTPPYEEGRIVRTLSEEDKWKCELVRVPHNRMYVQSESSSDNESSGEDSLSSGAHINFKSKGVTVSRLPGLVESIDHDILSEDSNFSRDGNDEESVEHSVGVYDDSDNRDSDGSQYAHSQEDGSYGASGPFGSISSPTEYPDDGDSMELTHMAQRALNTDENMTYHHRKRASETHAHPQSVHNNMTDFSYPDPSTGSVTEGSDGRTLNLLEESITPVERAPDLPVNLFCTEFSDAFFSSRTSNAPAKLDFNALKKHGLSSNTALTLSTVIGKKRDLEADSVRHLSTLTPLDADFVSQDRRSSLLLPTRHNDADVTVKKAVAVDTKASVKLTKSMLSVDRLRIIGQVDAKYVLARSGSLMIIIDQHAADERVKLEEMLRGDGDSNRSRDTEGDSGGNRTIEGHNSSTPVSTIRMTGTMPLSDTIEITSSDLYVLVNRPKIFHSWGFLFELIPEEENSALRSTTSVKLTQVPVFYGEALNADDFIEFVHYVSDHSRWAAPHSLLKPPSLKRIAASKACRTAVKFGDILDLERCTDIMSKLSETDLPFQCAHGRPSAVPLTYLKQSRGYCISPSISSASRPLLYDAGPKYLKSPNYSRLTRLMNN
jgi:DNA mismatch repair ATPase MutL